MEWEIFIKSYFRLLTAQFQDILPPDAMYKRIWEATEAMVISNDPQTTNEEVFIANFFSGLRLSPQELMPRFEQFYADQFGSLQELTEPVAGAGELVDTARTLGIKVAIATNPVFPESAILQRVEWAGLGDREFSLVTSYETMHFCKPNPRFYVEVAERLGVKPEECLMAGNDVEEDLVAAKVGMETFLVDRFLIDRGQSDLKPDGRGDLQALARQLRQKID